MSTTQHDEKMSIGRSSVVKCKKSVKLLKGLNGTSETDTNFIFSFFELHSLTFKSNFNRNFLLTEQ